MGTPTVKRKTVDLSAHADLVRAYRQACEDEKAIKAFKDKLGKQLRKKMGNAEQAEVAGVPVFTYARTEAIAWAKFVEAHGDIAERYKIVVEKETFDFDALAKQHLALVEPFRVRQFLVK